MNTISAISSKNTLRCHRRISETPLKFSNILVISRLKNHIIKGNAIPKIDWHYLCFYEFFVKNCCPFLTTLLSGSPIKQDGKLVGAVTHVILLASWPKMFGRALRFVLLIAKRSRSNLHSLADKRFLSTRSAWLCVADPTEGYGIFIENMLSAAETPVAKAS